jgi:hypothetical protein
MPEKANSARSLTVSQPAPRDAVRAFLGSAAMKMTRTERADLDRCTAIAKRIRAAERLSERPADIVLGASTLLTFERTLAGRQDQARPSEVLELRLNDPAGYKARVERSRPAAGMYGLDAVLARS